MTIAKNLFLIYLLLKPFYLFGSGGIQIGDIFLILSIIAIIVTLKINKPKRKELLAIASSNKLFIVFTLCTLAINAVYFLVFKETKFVLSTLYFVFNLLTIVAFSAFYKDGVFLGRMSKVLKFSIVAQLAIFLSGVGRYYTPDRYMGTFNDPNQLGYYIFICFLFIYVIKVVLNKKENVLVYLLMALFLIFQCASTGMLLGVGAFLVLAAMYYLKGYIPLTYNKLRKIMYISTLVTVIGMGMLLTTLALTANSDRSFLQSVYENQSIVERLDEKTNKADGEGNMSLWEDRGYDIIFKYPAYILLGAGEGGYDRYALATNNYGNEIHATLPGILFYYGIVPFCILLRWIYLRIKDVDPRLLIVYLALFIESFTLANQRQTLFWMIIAMGGLYLSKQAVQNGAMAQPLKRRSA